jgi:hypothetical protein
VRAGAPAAPPPKPAADAHQAALGGDQIRARDVLEQANQRHQHRAEDEEVHQAPQSGAVKPHTAQHQVKQHRLQDHQAIFADGDGRLLGQQSAEGGDNEVSQHCPIGQAQPRPEARPGGTVGARQDRGQRGPEAVQQPGRQRQQHTDLHHGEPALPQQPVLQIERKEQGAERQRQVQPQVEEHKQRAEREQRQQQRRREVEQPRRKRGDGNRHRVAKTAGDRHQFGAPGEPGGEIEHGPHYGCQHELAQRPQAVPGRA